MIKQIIPQEYCLKCLGCCRFKEADSIWAPQKIKLIPCDSEVNNFLCPFLNTKDNKCKIYATRPFDCQLYPFLINRKGKNIFLALDQNCAFIKENPKAPALMEYAVALAKLFSSPQYKKIAFSNNPKVRFSVVRKVFYAFLHHKKLFEDNPEIIQEYPGTSNLIEITI